MAGPLTDEQKDVRALRTALRSARVCLHTVMEAHGFDEAGGLKVCKVCFEVYPCTTRRLTRDALVKVDKGLG